LTDILKCKQHARLPDKSFIWLVRKLDKDQSSAIRDLSNPYLELRPEWKRVYPNGHVAGHVLGFTGMDHTGLDGIEYQHDNYLKGLSGWKSTLKDAKQRELIAKQSQLVLPVDGYDVQLSLDIVLQHAAEKYLIEACEKYKALGGTLVVLDSGTGDVLALANYPSFDPNAFSEFDDDERRNRAVTDVYEPGSVFKIFTLSAVLDKKIYRPEDKIYCENGEFYTGGRVLHDVKEYGNLSVAGARQKNIRE